MAAHILVYGYGNPSRQDDALGPLIARNIAALNENQIEVYDNYQLAIEDAIDIAKFDHVWFIDACTQGDEPFCCKTITPAKQFSINSHFLEPDVLIALTQHYYQHKPKAWLLAVRGYHFNLIEGLTSQAEQNRKLAVQFLKQQLKTLILGNTRTIKNL